MTEGEIKAGEEELDPPPSNQIKTEFKAARDRNEAAFVRSLPDKGVIRIEGFPPIIMDSYSDSDGVDIIKDMKAEGYFDAW